MTYLRTTRTGYIPDDNGVRDWYTVTFDGHTNTMKIDDGMEYDERQCIATNIDGIIVLHSMLSEIISLWELEQ